MLLENVIKQLFLILAGETPALPGRSAYLALIWLRPLAALGNP